MFHKHQSSYIGKSVFNDHLGSLSPFPCYNQPSYKEVEVYNLNYQY